MDENQTGHAEASDGAMMLLPITQNRTLLGHSHPDRVLLGAAASAVMDRLRSGKEHHPPSSLPTTLAPVHIFSIHEESLVEQTELIHSLEPDHPETADQNVHVQNAIALEIEHMLPAEELRPFERARHSRRRTKIIPKVRKSATRTLVRHVVVQYPGANDPDTGVLIQVICQRVNTTIADFDVGIEQADILSVAGLNSLVVAPGESKIFPVTDQSHLREPGFDNFGRAIRRGIIHHDDFNRSRFSARRKTFEALLQMLPVVPGKNYDRNIRWHIRKFLALIRDFRRVSSRKLRTHPLSTDQVRNLGAAGAQSLQLASAPS